MISPGLSSVPANRLPIIVVLAPTAMALVMSPEKRMPPSAMTGTSCRAAARAQSMTAVIIGTPMPAMIRVVQIDPAPMPTLTASTPRAISASVASAAELRASDAAILNYALSLEYLQAAFYTEAEQRGALSGARRGG